MRAIIEELTAGVLDYPPVLIHNDLLSGNGFIDDSVAFKVFD